MSKKALQNDQLEAEASQLQLRQALQEDKGSGNWTVSSPVALGGLSGGVAFSANTWEAELRSRFDGRCVGYTFALNEGGQLKKIGGGGRRRLAVDGQNRNSDANRIQHIASVSKTLTATLALRILDLYNVPLGAEIKDYLPSHWTIHSRVRNIKFRNLLRHKSGLNMPGAPTSYNELRKAIETGDADPNMRGNTYFYDNRNFGLFRLLIPYIANNAYMLNQETVGLMNGNLNAHLDDKTENLYESWMRFLIMAPLGFYNVDTKYDGTDPLNTLCYNFPVDGGSGNAGPDYGPFSGGGGWVMSAYMLAKFMAYRRYDNGYFAANLRTKMDNKAMGWQRFPGANGASYLGHAGLFTNSGPADTAIMQMPGNREAVVLVNSNMVNPNTNNDLRAKHMLVKAYEATVGII